MILIDLAMFSLSIRAITDGLKTIVRCNSCTRLVYWYKIWTWALAHLLKRGASVLEGNWIVWSKDTFMSTNTERWHQIPKGWLGI